MQCIFSSSHTGPRSRHTGPKSGDTEPSSRHTGPPKTRPTIYILGSLLHVSLPKFRVLVIVVMITLFLFFFFAVSAILIC